MIDTIETLKELECDCPDSYKTAQYLIEDLDHRLGQGVLFDYDPHHTAALVALAAKNPGKYILGSDLVDWYRYLAIAKGAGFVLGQDSPINERLWAEVSENISVRDILQNYEQPEFEYDINTNNYILSKEQLTFLLAKDYEYINGAGLSDEDLDFKGD